MNRLEKCISYFKNFSFRKKLFISYIVVIIIPITALGLFSYSKSKNYLHEQLRMSMNETVSQISSNVESKLKRQNDFINFLSFNPVLKEVLNNAIPDTYTLAQKLNENIEPIIWYYMTINMEIKELKIYSDFRTTDIGSFIEPSSKIKNEYWYKESLKSNSIYWWYDNGELFATRIIINKDDNSCIGILKVRLDPDAILSDIMSEKLKKYGYIINNSNGTVLNYKDGSTFFSDTDRKTIINSNNNIRIANEAYMIFKSPISTPNWTLCYYIPEHSATVDSSEILKATVTIALACLILLLFIIWLFSRTFVNRISNLNNKIELVEAGNLDIEILSNSKDEIGDLTNKFGRMLKKINVLINEVYEVNLAKKEAKLIALQEQIKPHFLYNSLSMINWKAISAGEKEISNITKLLSKFYRTTLNKGKSIILIRDEIENIKAYIDLQLMMHDYNFEVFYEFDEEILDLEMINFILQPIVENAIIHGIYEKLDEKGILKVSSHIKGTDIEFTIEDNGIGIDKDVISEILQKDTTGYGLKNINERIKLYFGNEYGLFIESELGKGTIVKFKIPQNKVC